MNLITKNDIHGSIHVFEDGEQEGEHDEDGPMQYVPYPLTDRPFDLFRFCPSPVDDNLLLVSQVVNDSDHEIQELALYDTELGAELWTSDCHTSVITTLSFSGDGTLIASGSCDRTVCITRSSDGSLLKRFLFACDIVLIVCMFSSGTSVVCFSSTPRNQMGKVHRLDLEDVHKRLEEGSPKKDGCLTQEIDFEDDGLFSIFGLPRIRDICYDFLAVSPDETKIAYAQSGCLVIHDIATNEQLDIMMPIEPGVQSDWPQVSNVVFSDDGDSVLCYSSETSYIYVYNVTLQRMRCFNLAPEQVVDVDDPYRSMDAIMELENEYSPICFAVKGSMLAVFTDYRHIYIWNWETEELRQTLAPVEGSYRRRLAFSALGNTIYHGGETSYVLRRVQGRAVDKLFRGGTKEEIANLQSSLSLDGSLIISWCGKGTACFVSALKRRKRELSMKERWNVPSKGRKDFIWSKTI